MILDAKTDYSFMRGYGFPQQWLARCKDVGAPFLGIADYCSTWGHKPFADAFKDSGVKLLFGVQVPVVAMVDKDPRYSLVTLIAKKSTDELYQAMTTAHLQTYYRPRLTWTQIKKLKDCVRIVNHVIPAHAKVAGQCCDYLGMSADMTLADKSVKLPPVLSYSPRFPAPEQRKGYAIVSALSSNQRIGESDEKAYHMFRDFSEANSIFGYALPKEAVDNAAKIAKLCKAELPKAKLMQLDGDLRAMAWAGAEKLGLIDGPSSTMEFAYQERLEYELSIIAEKKFEPYFYFVADLVQWARGRMLVGPGRGSSGGSLLCYLLGITTVDPLKFNTMFERFIDITRNDWPDIDIDFPDIRREEVFEYLRDKYGAANVARLGTLSEFGGKSALNDTARACGIPFDVSREIGKWTEGAGQGEVIPPRWIFEHVTEVKPLLEKHPDMRLAGLLDEREDKDDKDKQHIRHHGVHAAGVVVTTEPINRYGVVNKDGVISLDMKSAEKMGLIKMDALGLRTLSVLQEACDLAKIKTDTLFTLDWADAKVYNHIFNGDHVTGIFQFEGHAVRSLMKGIKVETFDDLCAITSLARPGPLIGGAAGHWVKCRNGESTARSLHKSLETTFGVICYQEQAMAIVRDLGGFDITEVNAFRRAVGKKDPAVLKAFREKFVAGATSHFGHKEGQSSTMDEAAREQAEDLWDELCEFGSYAFNLAHAVEYAMISYMCAWLKTYHPLEYAVACLRNTADDDQAKNLLRELAEEGYKYIPFDPDKSDATWAIIDGKLYGGFDSVRGIGIATAKTLLKKREAGGEQWMAALTQSQRDRLLKPGNTPWHTLTYFTDTYGKLYADPGAWRSEGVKAGFRGQVLRIKDIPEVKGAYAFLGKIKSRKITDMNEASRVAKRDGVIFDKNTTFVNLYIEDDTGEIPATINRWKVPDFEWLLESVTDGRDFFFRGNLINDGRRWLFIDNIVELKETKK